MNIDDRPTDDRRHFGKLSLMAITVQCVIRSTLSLILWWGFLGRWIKRRHFRVDQIQDGGRQPFKKFLMATCLQRVTRSTSCMNGHYRLLCPRAQYITVDAWQETETYFASYCS